MEEEICLFLDRKELEILLCSLDLVKDFNRLSKKSALLNKLINKINQCLQSYIDEDLTSQKEFSKQKFFEPIYNELISLFNKAKEPITISIDENIKYANLAFCKMLGYESENEIIELGLFNLISKRCLPIIKNLHNKRSKGEIVPNIHNLELKRADGRIISIECVHYCMPFNKSYFIISFYISLTKIQSLEKKLRESEERYRILFENSPVGIGIANTEGNVFEVNKTMRELTGHTSEELNAMGLASVYSDPSDRKRMLKTLQESHKVRDCEAKLKRKDGTEYIALMNIDVMKLRGKELLLMTIRDITERKKAEDIIRLHSEIMTNMAEGVYLIRTNDGIITYTNPKFEKMFGYNQGEMIGKHVSIVNAPTDRSPQETAMEIMKTLEDKGEWHGEVKNIKKDGTLFWCYANVSIFDHPEHGIVWVSVHSDITERKKAELKLKESEKKFHHAYNRENFYKDLFAHDINNILNNVLSAVELSSLFLNDPEKLEDIEELINLVNGQCRRGAKLIENVRKLSQIEEGNIFLKSMDMCKMLTKAIEFIKSSSLKKNINIRVESTVKKLFIEANELLFDLFENLLNNAVKYNDNSQIDIIIRISKVQKEKINHIKIEFLDNGIGIQDERKESIFQRAYNKDLSVRGMGFGLSLVKKIIEIYNGEIWIEDRVKGESEKGSNFIILIPEEV